MSLPIPTPIVVARRIAGVLLILSLVIVLIGIALLANWYLNRPMYGASSTILSSGPSGHGAASSTGSTFSSPSPKPPKPTKAESERAAVAALKLQTARDLDLASFQGQWVAHSG